MSAILRVPAAAAGLSIALSCAVLLATPASAQPDAPPEGVAAEAVFAFSIPAQGLEEALIEFGRQSRQELFYNGQDVAGKASGGVSGNLSRAAAMTALLDGTGLEYEQTASGGMMVGDRATLDAQRAARAEASAVPSGAAAPLVVAQAAAADVDPGMNAAGEPTTESVASAKRDGIEEIIVTARRREESVQDIPISITALTAEDMKAFGIGNIGDVEGIVPGINMGGGGNGVKKDSNPFIRGVGQRETKVTLSPAVGTYIDGIYLASTAGAMLDAIGVERIEVLRGPQGTLFGKNTTGGAISVTTKKPQPNYGARVSVNVGNYGRSDASVMVNGPLTDTILGRLTVGTKNSEGYFTNVVDNTRWGNDNRITGIGQLRWTPLDQLMFDFLAEHTRIRETPRPQKCALVDPERGSIAENLIDGRREGLGLPSYDELCLQSAALPDDKFASDYTDESPLFDQGRYWVDTTTAGLTATWDIDELGVLDKTQVKSITGWRRVEQIADEDLDATEGAYLLRIQPDFARTDQFSQEIQFTGSGMNDHLFFSTGVYYFKEETPGSEIHRAAGIAYGPRDFNQPGSTLSLNEPTMQRLETDNEALAWYGQIEFNLTDNWQLSAGLRFTHEERWSRYSKGFAVAESVLVDPLISMPNNPPGYVCVVLCPIYTEAELHDVLALILPMDEWDFEGQRPIPNYARPIQSEEGEVSNSAWTPMVSFKYHFGTGILEKLKLDKAMAYVTYSEGFSSGGITEGAVEADSFGQQNSIRAILEGNPLPGGGICEEFICIVELPFIPPDEGWGAEEVLEFEPERVKNYEIGMKLQALQRRVQANLAMFYMDYTNMQVSSTANRAGLPIPFVENIGKSVIKGLEAEFVLQPTPSWRVLLNASYTDADMKEWDAQVLVLDPITGRPTGTATEPRDDEPMPRTPRWQAFLLTDYVFPLSNGATISPLISARYTSEIYHGFDRGSFLKGRDAMSSDPTTFIDGRLSYISPDQRFEVALWGKNLTNKTDYLVGGIPLVDVTGATGQIFANPRTFGLTMTYNFGVQ